GEVHGGGHEQELDDGRDECAECEGCGAAREGGDVDGPCRLEAFGVKQCPQGGVDDGLDEGVDDGGECGTNDYGDGQVDDVAAHDELFEAFKHDQNSLW